MEVSHFEPLGSLLQARDVNIVFFVARSRAAVLIGLISIGSCLMTVVFPNGKFGVKNTAINCTCIAYDVVYSVYANIATAKNSKVGEVKNVCGCLFCCRHRQIWRLKHTQTTNGRLNTHKLIQTSDSDAWLNMKFFVDRNFRFDCTALDNCNFGKSCDIHIHPMDFPFKNQQDAHRIWPLLDCVNIMFGMLIKSPSAT